VKGVEATVKTSPVFARVKIGYRSLTMSSLGQIFSMVLPATTSSPLMTELGVDWTHYVLGKESVKGLF
jgi:hypothetical protein